MGIARIRPWSIDDFWYPKSDDIDVFDGTLDWIASVDYEGCIWIARPGRSTLDKSLTEQAREALPWELEHGC
jgi:hypothetical protein